MGRVLYTTRELRNEIIHILSPKKAKKIAITAFVGNGAENYIVQPIGLKLICWPKAGGTNPNILRALIQNGVEVYFCDSLHIKLYWSEKFGAVLTSANLSNNALGSGGLKEIGIKLAPSEINVKAVLKELKYKKAGKQELLLLDKQHLKYFKINNIKSQTSNMLYSEWYNLPHRPLWKIAEIEGDIELSDSAKRFAQNKYNTDDPCDHLGYKNPKDYHEDDWVLVIDKKDNNLPRIYWMYVDFTVSVLRKDKAYDPDCPKQAVQVWPLSNYEKPPFIIDKEIKIAIQKILQLGKNEHKSLARLSIPRKWFITGIYGKL